MNAAHTVDNKTLGEKSNLDLHHRHVGLIKLQNYNRFTI